MRNINIIAGILICLFGYLSYDKYQENQRNYEKVIQNDSDNRKGPKKRKTVSTPEVKTPTEVNVANVVQNTQVKEKQVMNQTKAIYDSSQELDSMYMCYTHDSFCRYAQNVRDIRAEKLRLYGDLQILKRYYSYEIPTFTDKDLANLKEVYGIDPYSDFDTIQGLLIMSYKMNNGLIVMKKDVNGNSKPYDKTYDNVDLNNLQEPKACYTQFKYCDKNRPSRKANEQDKLFILSVLKKQLNDIITTGTGSK